MTKQEAIDGLEELEKMFTDRISELHEVKGGQCARHAFAFYRDKIYYVLKYFGR